MRNPKSVSGSSGGSTWINVNEEITAQDLMESDSPLEENTEENDIIFLCEERSKEFQLLSENFIPSCSGKKDIASLFKEKLSHGVLWTSILTALDECRDFTALEKLCKEVRDEMPPLKKRVKAFISGADSIDTVAQAEIPPDGPRGLNAVMTVGDGNCMPRSVSRSYFNDDSFHLELRARFVVEGVLNKELYLKDDILERGATYLHENADLPTVFPTFSEFYTPGQRITPDSISAIYSLEVHSLA